MLRLTALFLAATLITAADKPNVVIINIDDLGYADIGPFGSTINRTPNLDRMAAEGCKLTAFYAAPVCSPSRAALMTGSYPKRSLPIPHVLFPIGDSGLSPDEVTVAEVVKSVGYTTACIGKWHLGDQPEFLPTRQGFDVYFGLPYSNDMGPVADGTRSDLGKPIPEGKGKGQPPLPLMRQETVLKRVLPDDQCSLVELYTTEAVSFIKANREKPFLLYMPHNAVHFPIYPGRAFQKRNSNGIFSDWIEEVDWSVGQILEALRQAGIDDRTLVLFTSDNGGTNRGSNAPLRGHKGSTWEGGIRVPTLARWPGHIPAGSSVDAISGMIDVLPTVAALSGASLPAGRKLDGMNLLPLLTAQAGAQGHEVFHYYRGLKLEALRWQQWKLHLGSGELYDLKADPGEATNVAQAHAEVVARIKQLAAEMDKDLGLDGIGPGVRPLGKVQNPKPLIGFDGVVREGLEPK
jgi:arylsulfatase A-like enzyme